MTNIGRRFRGIIGDVLNQTFWWIMLAGVSLSLLIYGFSFFLARPTVETITTSAPQLNSEPDASPGINAQKRRSKKNQSKSISNRSAIR